MKTVTNMLIFWLHSC